MIRPDGYDTWLSYSSVNSQGVKNYRAFFSSCYIIAPGCTPDGFPVNNINNFNTSNLNTQSINKSFETDIEKCKNIHKELSACFNSAGISSCITMCSCKTSIPDDASVFTIYPEAIPVSFSEIDKDLGDEGFSIISNNSRICVYAKTYTGLLYAAFKIIRMIQMNEGLEDLLIKENPSLPNRILNHWDNLDGSIERGYAGESLWKWDELPGLIDDRYTDYARMLCSIGINGSVLNNVNTQPEILSSEYISKIAALASVFRPWGIKTYVSVNFGSPMSVGGLKTADPLNSSVMAWWEEKVSEIYGLIPDFGGFLIKADSEGQPGPYAYGRTHAEGANMIAKILSKFNGILVWRAFVYGHGETDRAKKAYADFKPLDGKFLPNVNIQVKNGPIDFQPREPVHPMFGGMEHTNIFMEFQIAQEYLGQGNHLVYLAPMWKEIFEFDTKMKRDKSQVKYTIAGIAAVSNTGNNKDWCGSLFHTANLYAYGRLAWNYELSSEEIAREWTLCTWGSDKTLYEIVMFILMNSWEACVNYMTPLCLHHIMKYHHHYGPDPACDEGEREDWKPRYYHRADSQGLGFDRTRKGSSAVDQYAKPVADMFNDISTCPEKYLLWFHHVPWTYILSSGRTLKDELAFVYNRGVSQAEALLSVWEKAEPLVSDEHFKKVLHKLEIQVKDAYEWRDVCLNYFLSFTEQIND